MVVDIKSFCYCNVKRWNVFVDRNKKIRAMQVMRRFCTPVLHFWKAIRIISNPLVSLFQENLVLYKIEARPTHPNKDLPTFIMLSQKHESSDLHGINAL